MQAIIVWGDIDGPIISAPSMQARRVWGDILGGKFSIYGWSKKVKVVLLLGLVHVILHASSFINDAGPAFSHHHQACKEQDYMNDL
jgi:hypothetical protein